MSEPRDPGLGRPLDVLGFPFPPAALIEASAGTGKTYTIAALYLRLVLGHGGAAAFGRPLVPSEILVMTFTDAATRELRDRIRARLSDASRYFARSEGAVGDPLLHALRAAWPEHHWPALAHRLALAAQSMDEAAVMTIHGWCNRMLGEHAFDTGSLFGKTLVTDPLHWRDEAARDYWRTFIQPLSAADARPVLAAVRTPRVLRDAIGGLLSRPALLVEGVAPADLLRQRSARLAALKQAWRPRLTAFVDAVKAHHDAGGFDKKVFNTGNRDRWLAGLLAWLDDPSQEALFPPTGTARARLAHTGLRSALKNADNPSPADLEVLDLACIEAIEDEILQLGSIKGGVLAHAAHWIAARVAREHERLGQLDFDQLLTGLDQALQGPGGERLARTIRQQFPVALIDEFQDTDPIQYRIFDTLYGPGPGGEQAGPEGRTALILIGDPKQAIYAFRGADIHTYLEARARTMGEHYTLATNHRSSTAMVAAVNRLFEQAETRPPGAFMVERADGQRLPFHPVGARGRRETWEIDGQRAAALTCWVVDPDAGGSRRALVDTCADRIAELLALGARGRAGFVDAEGRMSGLRPADIAVLVNRGSEAVEIRQALARRGVRSVYLSENESVFLSPIAAEVSAWLRACAEPERPDRLRAALATSVLGLSWARLDEIQQDDLVLERELLRFREYQAEWRRRGVLAVLRRLMFDFDVPRRLLGQGDERSLTDLLHLAELLQQAASDLDGEPALCRFLDEARAAAATRSDPGDAQRQRLESDQHLVTVVTVHKSKGLEYPLVFLPFADHARTVDARTLPWIWHDGHGQARVCFETDPTIKAEVVREQLTEDLRKLYVALTRARHATWVGLGGSVSRTAPMNALVHLLGQGDQAALWIQHLEGLGLVPDELSIETVGAVPVAPSPASDAGSATGPRGGDGALVLAPSPPLRAAPQPAWWVASFSGLLKGLGEGRPGAAGPDEAAADGQPGAGGGAADAPGAESVDARRAIWDEESAARTPGLDAGGEQGIHGFPRGAEIGSLLHGLLQYLGEQGFARARDEPALAREWIERRQRLLPDPADRLQLLESCQGWLDTPLLPGTGAGHAATLAGFTALQIELEFWIEAPTVDIGALDRRVRAATLDGAPRQPINPRTLRGMLKGFIDLVFEHEGRYFVLDYKSNWLGPDAGHYGPARLQASMIEHRYDLQAVLYLFALHRLLKARLPDYDYERHVGGALYWYLRAADAPGAGVFHLRPDADLMDALDALFSHPSHPSGSLGL